METFHGAAKDILGRGELEGPAQESFERAFKAWTTFGDKTNIEEFYVHSELMDLLEPQERPRVSDAQYLISKTLKWSIKGLVHAAHDTFVDGIYRDHYYWDYGASKGGHRTRPLVISMNWDNILDNAISNHKNLGIDYGIESRLHSTSKDLDDGKKDFRLPLLKLHGSLNWWSCPKDEGRRIWYTKEMSSERSAWTDVEGRMCDEHAGTKLRLLFVPPASEKMRGSTTSIFPSIWRNAQSALGKCQTVTFLGYSLPPTDVQFRVLLLDALNKNRVLERVRVVTKPRHGDQRVRFEERYAAAFAGTDVEDLLEFEYQPFERWVASRK